MGFIAFRFIATYIMASNSQKTKIISDFKTISYDVVLQIIENCNSLKLI